MSQYKPFFPYKGGQPFTKAAMKPSMLLYSICLHLHNVLSLALTKKDFSVNSTCWMHTEADSYPFTPANGTLTFQYPQQWSLTYSEHLHRESQKWLSNGNMQTHVLSSWCKIICGPFSNPTMCAKFGLAFSYPPCQLSAKSHMTPAIQCFTWEYHNFWFPLRTSQVHLP